MLSGEKHIELLPGQTEVEPLKLLRLLTHAKDPGHEVLVYHPETGGCFVNPKGGAPTSRHGWSGKFPTPEEALLAAKGAGLEPTGVYYCFDVVELRNGEIGLSLR